MKLMIVDGNSILNRAFYGIRLLTAPDGTPTNAIFGFLNIFHKYFSEEKPDAVAVCFDVSKKTFRNEIFKDYKGTRKGMPDELRAQMPIMKELLSYLGYSVLGLEGFEADDLIGTLSTAASDSNHSCVIITGDRDSLQLVDERVTVLLPSTRSGKTDTTVYTPDKVLENMGVRPDQIVDLKALMGDSSDNIPGVKGIGEKTAADLISKFETLDGLYSQIEGADVKPAAKQKLIDGKEDAYLSQTLATINRAVPIETDILNYKIKEIDKESAAALLLRLNLMNAMKTFGLSAADAKNAPSISEKVEEKEEVIESVNYTLIRTDNAEDIKSAADGKEVCYFVRAGLVYAAAGDKIFICSDIKGISALDISKHTYDCKAQYLHALKSGFELKNVAFDLKLAAYLLEPTASDYDFASLVTKYGQGESKCDFVAEFGDDEEAISDIVNMPYLCKKLARELKKQNMLSLLSEIEIPLSETLSNM